MKKHRLFVSLLIFATLSPYFSHIFGVLRAQSTAEVPTPAEVAAPSNSGNVSNQVERRSDFLNRIKQELKYAQSDYTTIGKHKAETEAKLTEVQGQKMTLQDQLTNLENQIKNTASLMENIVDQIGTKEDEIKALYQNLELTNAEIENQKQMLSEYVDVLYEQHNSMHDVTDEHSPLSMAKLLLSDKPPAEALQELKYFQVLQNTGHEIFDRLEALGKAQQDQQTTIENDRNKLTMLYRDLDEQKQTLDIQRGAKVKLLEETAGQEKIYQQLVEESKMEQLQVLYDVESLHNNLAFIQAKINELGDKFNPDDFKSVLNKESTDVYNYIATTKNENDFAPRWPVSPNRGISAYFHDAGYRRVMGIPHEAIDIPTPQGTPIHAPADGVVYKTKDNGFGYSYIILAHTGGFMTVYGHVSEIRVQEGQKIEQGNVIGLSGATPGTKGAGLMTTGAHLHFEVLKGGVHVDPLDYLPLSYLPLESLPAKYLIRITGDAMKVKRETQDAGPITDDKTLLKTIEKNGKFETSDDGSSAGSTQP